MKKVSGMALTIFVLQQINAGKSRKEDVESAASASRCTSFDTLYRTESANNLGCQDMSRSLAQ
jgi:hypothetical protein